MRIVLVGIAGAAGALGRYGIAALFGARAFPWPTLGVNVVGSLLLGVLLVAGPSRLTANTTLAVAVGFLGAFTTFSTFSYETVTLFRAGRPAAALGYVALSTVAGVAAAAIGYRLGQSLI